MGAFYNSISIPGGDPDLVRQAVDRWLAVRGYELSNEPALFDLDGDNERSLFLIYNSRWTIVFFSHYEEELRLIRELQPAVRSLLYLWVYDSDVWGYDVFSPEGFAGSFSSNPRDHISFPDHELGDGDRPAADPKRVCELLGLEDLGADIRAIQQRKSAYKEDICRQLCSLVGVEPALASYDDLECGESEKIDGWKSLHLLYVRQRYETGEINLHDPEMLQRPLPAGLPRVRGDVDLPPELIAEMERMRRRVRMTMMILKPVSWVARGWRKAYEASFKLTGQGGRTEPAVEQGLRVHHRFDGECLINDRHGCQIALPAEARPLPGSRKPSSVFAFRIGDLNVTCTARHLSKIDEVLRQPGGSKLLRDEMFHASGHRARHFLFELSSRYVAGAEDPSFLGMYVVQTPQGLYVFLYRYSHPPIETLEHKIRRIVESFEFLAQDKSAVAQDQAATG